MEYTVIADFVKEMRRQFGLTQVDLADKSGVGLRFKYFCMTAWQADWWKTKTDSPLHTTQII